jgi:hypothetical protein
VFVNAKTIGLVLDQGWVEDDGRGLSSMFSSYDQNTRRMFVGPIISHKTIHVLFSLVSSITF